MSRIDLDIYREYYADSPLADIWDKVAEVLADHGMPPAGAEYLGLQITEWIRTTWGGLILVERHISDPQDHSRFDLLRERTLVILAEATPGAHSHAAVAAEIVRVVRIDYRGKYITRIKRLDQLQRDYEIYNKGNTAAQIEQMALQNNISVVRAYQINAAMQKRKDKREQPLLPFA